MKTVALAMMATGLAFSAAQAQPMTSMGGENCLKTDWIDHTKSPNNRTILFYMRDNKVWQSRLSNECPLLGINGFIYSPAPPDEICGNLQTIRVLQSGTICKMGPIVPYAPPAQGS